MSSPLSGVAVALTLSLLFYAAIWGAWWVVSHG